MTYPAQVVRYADSVAKGFATSLAIVRTSFAPLSFPPRVAFISLTTLLARSMARIHALSVIPSERHHLPHFARTALRCWRGTGHLEHVFVCC